MWCKRILRGFTLLSGVMVCGFVLATSTLQPVSKAIAVEVTAVQKSDITRVVTAFGSLSAINMVMIRSEVSGRIAKLYFKDGDTVKKGMPIIQLDDAEAQADYKSAVTSYKLARAKYLRSKKLLNEAVSVQDLAKLKAEMDNQWSTVQSKEASLNMRKILAPIDGQLTSFNTHLGSFINSGFALVQLVDTTQLKVIYPVPEIYVPNLRLGQVTSLKTSIYPNLSFVGAVSYLSPVINPSNRSVLVQAIFSNPKNILRSGMFVLVTQNIGTVKNALVIPQVAVMADIQGYYVYRVVGNQALKTYITINERPGSSVSVSIGLAVDDQVVIAGGQKLRDGSIVKVVSRSTHAVKKNKKGGK